MSYLKQFKRGYFNNLGNLTTESPFPKSDFPIFSNNNELIWFDNGATTQRPNTMIDAIKDYYDKYNSNIHRSPHKLSMISSEMFDNTREQTAKYIGCDAEEIIFVKGTTEGINLLANSINFMKLSGLDAIPEEYTSTMPLKSCRHTVLISNIEHHSNILPWQLLYKKNLINLEYLIYDKINNRINLEDLEMALSRNPSIKVVSITHVSNVLGIINPIKEMAEIVHRHGAILVIDGAQGIGHKKINVKDIGCDAYVFSSHKLFGPTGVGCVYVNKDLYQYLDVYQSGGGMIKDVTMYDSTFQDAPYKFEAGSQNVADVIAFGETIRYLSAKDWSKIEAYEKILTEHLHKRLKEIPGIVILGDTIEKVPIYSFVIDNVDYAALLKELDKYGIACRWGHHCSQLIIRDFGYESCIRVSLAPYNSINEIDYFISIVKNFIKKNNN